MISAILSLFGCHKKPRTLSVSTTENGPFTIEAVTTRGKGFNMNSGSYTYEKVSYGIKYKGKPLESGNKLEVNTGIPGIWRVFLLKTAPQPALIFGSQSLFLVTEENGSPKIKPLHEQSSDFASIQWMDSENGQPGIYREIYSSDQFDTNNILEGGRYLVISHASVFDTKTFDIYPFNLDNKDVDGYHVHQRKAVFVSPDSSQIVFCGYKDNEADYMLQDLALVSYDFKNQSSYSVPFKKEELHLKNESLITTDWMFDYFEWVQEASGQYRLQAKAEKPKHRKGLIYFERHKGYKYSLDPVSESMMEHLAGYIKQELQLDASKVNHEKLDWSNKIKFDYPGANLILQYGEYGNDLVLKEDPAGTETSNKKMINGIGKGFNAILAEGKYQDLFLTDSL